MFLTISKITSAAFPDLAIPMQLRRGEMSVVRHLTRQCEVQIDIFLLLSRQFLTLIPFSILDWYSQKEAHPWYLSTLNSFLSPMDPDAWNIVPNDSNIIETSHAGRNAETGIGRPLLLAINL